MVDAIRFAFDILSFISVMVLVVLGLGIIASMMGIFNFAHGEFVLLGAFTMFMVADAGHNSLVGDCACSNRRRSPRARPRADLYPALLFYPC